MLDINIQFSKLVKTTFIIAIAIIISCQSGISQRFNSLVGIKLGYETAAVSAKIALDEKNYLEGSFGIMTPQPEYTVGPSISYHRHIALNESKDFQLYFGAGGKAAIGDAPGFGVGVDIGLIYIFKKISLGLDLNPSYFFNEALGFKPLYGINLRWVND